MAKSFGLPGTDDESNRAFAAKLMKYAGWRSVTYQGKGVFDVDYHMEGRLTQDFVFPLMPDSNIVIPFIALRRRTDGAVLVNAPALTGGTNMFGPMAQQMGGGETKGPPSRAEGRFTVHTDGEIVTNNSEDGPAADPLGQQVHWDIAPGIEQGAGDTNSAVAQPFRRRPVAFAAAACHGRCNNSGKFPCAE